MTWLPRLLFLVTVLLSMVLAGAVFVAPIVDSADTDDIWSNLQALFAADITVRRTAVASAIGLMVTAFIFFRARAATADSSRRKHRPPPGNIAGA